MMKIQWSFPKIIKAIEQRRIKKRKNAAKNLIHIITIKNKYLFKIAIK
jgi:hypothetical protein